MQIPGSRVRIVIEPQRAAMSFVPTDAATVSANERAAKAATASREAECAKRGNFCREREADERKAHSDLATSTAAKTLTDRAAALDAEIALLQAHIAKAGPVDASNPNGAAIASLFQLPKTAVDWLATWQQFAIAVIVELLIVSAFVSFELLGREHHLTKGSDAHIAKKATVEAAQPPVVVEQVPEPKPIKITAIAPPKPRLVATETVPVGNVVSIMAELDRTR